MKMVDFGNFRLRVLASVVACLSVITIIGCSSGGGGNDDDSPKQPVVQDLNIQSPDGNDEDSSSTK